MKISWIYCLDNRNLPPLYSTRVCIFETHTGPKLESCTLVEDLMDTSFRKFWVIKGDASKREVSPIAWLRIEDVTGQDVHNITELKELEFVNSLTGENL